MEQTNLELKKGDSWERTLIFEDEDGNRLDIEGWKIYFMAKTNLNDVDGSATGITKTVTSHSSASTGETEISLTSTDTNVAVGTYQFAIKAITDNLVGITAEAITVLEGMLVITDAVIQAVS